MKSFIKNGIGKVVTDYGTKVMDILSKGRLGQSIFTFFGIVKADALQLPEKGAPGTPAANKGGIIYVKSDGKPYFKSSTTSESDLTQGGGSGTSEKIHLQVRNDEGATIPAGAPLYSRGEIGGSDRILVGICDADSAAKMPCIGLAEAEMNTTSTKDNFAITQGVYNTNISGFTGLAVGDNLYVDTSGSAPHLIQTKPTGEASFIQNVGIVLKTNGTTCQGLQVSAIGRANDTPNLNSGYIFYGDSNNQARSTQLSTLLPPDLTVDGAGTVHANNITGVGVVTSGEWRGTAIASAYLDSDTAHLSGTQTFTGAKTFEAGIVLDGNRSVAASGDGVAIHLDSMDITNSTTSASGTASFYNHVVIENPRVLALNSSVTTTEASTLYIKGAPVASTNQTITRAYALNVAGGNVKLGSDLEVTGIIRGKQRQIYQQSFIDDLGTTKHYLPWRDTDEQTTIYQEEAAMIAPYDGRIVSVTMRCSALSGSGNRTIGIHTFGPNASQFTTGNWTEEEVEAVAVESTDDNHVFYFVFDNAKHFESGELVTLSIQDDADLTSSLRYTYISTVVEWDYNNGLGTGTSSAEFTAAV